METTMRPGDLLVRCLAEFDGRCWTAVSLEFGLAVQADTFEDARHRLDSQIQSYLYDALVGVDRAHARYLLNRRAPFVAFLKYYLACFRDKYFRTSADHKQAGRKLFVETLRMQPA